MCFVHCSQQINVGCRVVLCEPVPPVASLLYLTSFFVSSNQPRHLGPAQPCHRCHVLPQQTLNRALLFPIFLIANRARHPFIDLMPSSRLEPNLLAGLQKCPDLFQAQFFCVLHAYLQSQACEIQSPSGSCCVINTVALQAHPALYKTLEPHSHTLVDNPQSCCVARTFMSAASRLVSTRLKFSCVQDDKHRDESRCGSLKATPRFYLGGTMVRIRYDTHIDFVSVCRRCRRRAGRNVFHCGLRCCDRRFLRNR